MAGVKKTAAKAKKAQGVAAKRKINAAGKKAGKPGSAASNLARWTASRAYRRRGL